MTAPLDPKEILRALRHYPTGLDLDLLAGSLGLKRRRSRWTWWNDESDAELRRRCEIAFLERFEVKEIRAVDPAVLPRAQVRKP